jgi:hypothetical protein
MGRAPPSYCPQAAPESEPLVRRPAIFRFNRTSPGGGSGNSGLLCFVLFCQPQWRQTICRNSSEMMVPVLSQEALWPS